MTMGPMTDRIASWARTPPFREVHAGRRRRWRRASMTLPAPSHPERPRQPLLPGPGPAGIATRTGMVVSGWRARMPDLVPARRDDAIGMMMGGD